MENKGIGVSNLPNSKHEQFFSKGTTFNMMVAGSRGLGKTSFLNSFIGKEVFHRNPFDNKNDIFWYTNDVCNIQENSVIIEENGFSTKMDIVEVDGIGDLMDNTKSYLPVKEYLEERFLDFSNKFKKNLRCSFPDRRIHLCIYFLEPLPSIKAADLLVMKEITLYCNLIPVISKSDLIDEIQRKNIEESIKKILEEENISVFENEEQGFGVPFYLVNNSGKKEYNWGLVEENSLNELSSLREFILQKNLIQIISETDYLYDAYRTSSMVSSLIKNESRVSDKKIYKIAEEQKNEILRIKEEILRKKELFNK